MAALGAVGASARMGIGGSTAYVPAVLGGLTGGVSRGAIGRSGGPADPSTHTAITRVQSATAVTATAQSSLTATFPSGGTATAGNTLIAAASSDATIPTPSGWTLVTPGVVDFTGHYQWMKIAAGGETGLTIAPNGTVTAELYVEEMRGLAGSPLDVSTSNDPATNASSISTGTTGTTAQADEYAFASFSWNDAPASGATLSTLTNPPNVAPRFVKLADLRGLDPTAMDTMLAVAGRMLGATGTVSSTAILSAFAGRPTGIVATFKAGVAGGSQELAGTSAGTSASTGDIAVSHELVGASASTSVSTADLVAAHALVGESASTSTTTGGLAGALVPFAGTSTSTGASSGDVAITHALAGTSTSTATTTGDARVSISLVGQSASASTTAGDLTDSVTLGGASQGVSATTGVLALMWTLAGDSTGTSTTTGALGIAGLVVPVGCLEGGGAVAQAESGSSASSIEFSGGIPALVE